MPFNHVLEYDVVDPGLVTMVWQGKQSFRPTTCEELKERFRRGCEKLQKEQTGNRDYEVPDMCSNPQSYESLCQEGVMIFFFGVGLPAGNNDMEHRREFFNNKILLSFPHLKNLPIQSFGPANSCDRAVCSDGGAQPKGAFDTPGQARLVEASSVVDCGLTGPIVTFPDS